MEEIKIGIKEKSMKQKVINGEITWSDYRKFCKEKQIKKEKSMRKKYYDKEITYKEYIIYLAKKYGFKNIKDYLDYLSQKHGYRCYNDYVNKQNYKNHRCNPMSENKNCAQYLGIYIAERLLSKIFEDVQRMPNNFSGYDFICGKGFKIDVKSCSFNKIEKMWRFYILKNKTADYFLLLAFDNREDLNPLHIWLIRGDEIVGIKGKLNSLNNKNSICIGNTELSLKKYKCYEQNEKLEKLVSCCNKEKT